MWESLVPKRYSSFQGSQEEDDADDERPVHDAVESILPESVPWRPSSSHLPIWRDLQACLPSNHADWTASLASTVVGDVSGQVTYGSEKLSASDGRDRVITFGNELIEGSLERVPENRRLEIDALTGPTTPKPGTPATVTPHLRPTRNAPDSTSWTTSSTGSPTTVRTAMAETVSHSG